MCGGNRWRSLGTEMRIEEFRRSVTINFPNPATQSLDMCEQAKKNAETNILRGLPELHEKPANKLSAVIVGSGPSLNTAEIAPFRHREDVIFAVSRRAAKTLNAVGIVPDYLILASPKDGPELPYAKHYLMATQCAPPLVECIKNDVTLFHGVIDGVGFHVPRERGVTLVGGRMTLGGKATGAAWMSSSAIGVVLTMGFRDLHLHGFDCSFPEPASEGVPVTTEYDGRGAVVSG